MAQIEVKNIDVVDYKKFIKLLPKGYMEQISKYINHQVKPRMIRKVLKNEANDHHGIMEYAIHLAEVEQVRLDSLKQKIKTIASK